MYQSYKDARGNTSMDVPTLVDAPWLQAALTSGKVKVVDCTWHMPQSGRVARDEHPVAHIPGAVFLDLDECRDKDAKYGEQMLPSSERFGEYMGQLGLSNCDHIVLYDNNEDKGLFSAPRTWFMLRVFGHQKISVLNGGLPQWKAHGGEVTSVMTQVKPASYTASYQASLLRSYEDVLQNTATKDMVYVDVRPNPRFVGQAPEPIPGVKPGHIPRTVNLPFPKFLGSEPRVLRPAEELMEVIKAAGIDLTKPTVISCGSGLTACIVLLGAYTCGHTDLPLYDGAWAEWYHRAPAELKADVPTQD